MWERSYPAGSSDRTSKSQRIGRLKSHLTNRGVGVRWGSDTNVQGPICLHFPLFQAGFNTVHDPVLAKCLQMRKALLLNQ